MPIVTNPLLKRLAAAARAEWDSVERQHDVEYQLTVGGQRLVAWVNSSAHNAMLNTLSVQVLGENVQCTYLQVRRDGLAIRALTRIARAAEIDRWLRVYPKDRKSIQKVTHQLRYA